MSYCDLFLNKGIFKGFEEGAYLSKLDKNHILSQNTNKYHIRPISVEDLDLIVELYKQVFESFAPKEVMEKKLAEKRGRGVCIEIDGKIGSVAQSDFETKDGALIVGVATAKEYRGQGLGTECLKFLCNNLQKEGKDLFLQYHNLDAEGIYNRLGFKKIDQVIHYFKE
jgi:predicted GNAT family acetyltransferase